VPSATSTLPCNVLTARLFLAEWFRGHNRAAKRPLAFDIQTFNAISPVKSSPTPRPIGLSQPRIEPQCALQEGLEHFPSDYKVCRSRLSAHTSMFAAVSLGSHSAATGTARQHTASPHSLARAWKVSPDLRDPHAILLRSHKLQEDEVHTPTLCLV